jgi:hypothetical protein
MSHVEARCVPGCARKSLYGKEWEVLEGSEGLDRQETALMLREWQACDKRDYGHVVSEYRFVEG